MSCQITTLRYKLQGSEAPIKYRFDLQSWRINFVLILAVDERNPQNVRQPDKGSRPLFPGLKGRSHGDSVVSCLCDRLILTKPVSQGGLDRPEVCKGWRRKELPSNFA
ncbi:hypothetical protein KM043_016833 [Ampulex compressa]|nr:hypothetical protein KM043_016833 [Ampulex compressa]